MIKIQNLQSCNLSKSSSNVISHLLVLVVYTAIIIVISLKFTYLLKITLPLFILPVASFFYLFKKTDTKNRLLFLKRSEVEEEVNTLNERLSHQEKLKVALHKKIDRYSYLEGLVQKLSLELSLDGVYKILMKAIPELFKEAGSNCILYLVDQERQELNLACSRVYEGNEIIKTKKGDIFDHWVLKKMQPLLVENVKTDFRFDLSSLQPEQIRPMGSLISVALIAQSRPIGIIRLDSGDIARYDSEDLRLLSTLSDLFALAIQNALFYQHAKELAIKDGLTGLYLRRFFAERLGEEIEKARLRNSSVSLLMLDVDNFKRYNDKFGHIAGDIVLKLIAKMLTTIIGTEANVICRYGGEEFMILLPDCTKKDALLLANNISHGIAAQDIILRRKKTNVTVSIGMVTFPADSQSEEDLINKVDLVMYRAKQLGKNKVCSY